MSDPHWVVATFTDEHPCDSWCDGDRGRFRARASSVEAYLVELRKLRGVSVRLLFPGTDHVKIFGTEHPFCSLPLAWQVHPDDHVAIKGVELPSGVRLWVCRHDVEFPD